MVYKWKGASMIRADANEAGALMDDLSSRGCLTAETLVEVSRPTDSVLHDEFEWNDTIAAQEYRKEQARHIIQALIIVEDDNGHEYTEPVRAYCHLEKAEAEYTHIKVALQREDMREVLLYNALSELEAFRRKYNSLKELAAVVTAIDLTIEHNKRG